MLYAHKKILPVMRRAAREMTIALGLISLISVGGGFYFFRQITIFHAISNHLAQEAFIIGEIALSSNQYAMAARTPDVVINGMAYAELAAALSSMERHQQALMDESRRPGIAYTSGDNQDRLTRQNTLLSAFIMNGRAYLQAGGKGDRLPPESSEKLIDILKELTDETEALEKGAVHSLMLLNVTLFAGLTALLIWFWFTRMRPISAGVSAMGLQAQEIESRLHAEEERARALTQFSTDAVISFDERGTIDSFNQSAETVFGFEADEILGKPVKLLMSENEAFYKLTHFANFKPRDLANLANGISMKGKRKNGEIFQARLIVNELWSKGRRGFVANIHDQSEEAAAQNRLQESLERFDLCVRGSDSAIWDVDLRNDSMFVAPRLMQLLGYDEHEPITSMSRIMQLVHPDDRETVRTRAGTSRNPGSAGFESRFRMRDCKGDYRWFQNKGVYRHDGNGATVRVAGSITEITARVQAEEELRRHRDHLVKMVDAQTRQIRKSEARLSTAISGIPEGLCLLDENKLIVLVNRHMINMYPEVAEIMNPGVSLDDIFVELLEKNRSDSEPIQFIGEHFTALRGDAPAQELRMPGGGWMRITRARTQDGGEFILHTDIRHYKEQETRLQSQARELEQALGKEKEINSLHKQFVTMASHEFRTPLAIIDGSAQFMAREADKLTPERVVQRAEKIRGAVSRMTKLIESTLTVARLDAGKIEIEARPCDLRALIADVCERHQELSPSHQISMDLEELPDSIIADYRAMDQVLTNLLSNAVKYSPGSPAIRVRGWRAGAFALVSVRDHGLGISEEDAPKIFSRFFRAQNAAGTVGTGIGLNLVKELVTLHGGAVHMESRAGLGSTFTIRLPVKGPHSMPQKGMSMAAAG